MKKVIYRLVLAAAALCLVWAGGPRAEEAHDHLEALKHLCGPKYVGHYSNPEDAHIDHFIQWEMLLDGHAVRSIKEVPELNFTMETLFFWDPETKRIHFFSVSNRGQVSKGAVQVKFGVVNLVGVGHSESGRYQFKTTFELLKNGELHDRFYRMQGQQFKQGHHITYKPVDDSAGE